MTRRGFVTVGMIVAGLILMIWSYFFGAASWCVEGADCSTPPVEWAPAIFVVGVIVAFSSAIYYEVAKDKKE